MKWETALRERFGSRSKLALAQLLEEFEMSGVDMALFQDGLSVFEMEYGIPIGVLRPDDPLRLFTEPPSTRNPLSWLFNRAAVEDRASELNYQLARRRKAAGLQALQRPPLTVGEYITAWLGKS